MTYPCLSPLAGSLPQPQRPLNLVSAAPQIQTQRSAPFPQNKADGTPLKRKLNHKCPWQGCDRWLSCQHNVEQHIREAHTGEKPYRCDRCGAGFARPFSLYRHLWAKHGVEAKPGRGKGGGLKALGIEKAVKKRTPGRKAEAYEATDGVDRTGYPNTQQPALPHFQQPPPAAVEKQDAHFAVNNFTPIPTACVCGLGFDNREALLAHLHSDHGDPPSRSCNCMLCLGMFGGHVDVAGVHVAEKTAVRMRKMMAGDLFGGDEEMASPGDVMSPDHAAMAKDAKQPAPEDTALRQQLAAIGMTIEQLTASMNEPTEKLQSTTPRANTMTRATPVNYASMSDEQLQRFTANMPKLMDVDTPAPVPHMLDAEAEARFTANVPASDPYVPMMDDALFDLPDQLDVEGLDEWLKSAEYVFGLDGGDTEAEML